MTKKTVSDFHIDTQITQLGRDLASQSGFVNALVYRGSTVVFPTMDALLNNRAEFNYGTAGTPTIKTSSNPGAPLRAPKELCCHRPGWAPLYWHC